MAQRRLISASLGSSQKFHALACCAGKLGEFSQLLFPLIVTKVDDHGRMAGDAFTVKLNVFPSSPRREKDFDFALNKMQAVGLIQLYESDGKRYLYVLNFRREQPGLKPAKNSRYPEPPEPTKQTKQIEQHPDTPGDSREPAETPGNHRLSVSVSVSESESVSESLSGEETKSGEKELAAPRRGDPAEPVDLVTGRPKDPAFECFAARFLADREIPYVSKVGDFVQLAGLRKRCGVRGRDSPPKWAKAIANYFDSPLGKYTLADLCGRYDTFMKSRVNEFGKEATGGKNAGSIGQGGGSELSGPTPSGRPRWKRG